MISFSCLLTVSTLFVSVAHCSSLSTRADGLKVISPGRGDRFGTGIDIIIRWEVSDEENVKLEVGKGDPEDLTTVHIITRM